MTDSYTDELFQGPADVIERVVFPVSRLVVDPERFEDDANEPMVARGMGVIYERTSHGGMFRATPTPAERTRLLDTYYLPHHNRLRAAVARALEPSNSCLVIDCHSFPSKPLPYEFDQNSDRPQICIGTDPVHTPEGLTLRVEQLFADAGFTVARDRPFAGALVPTPYYGCDRCVAALMIEVNRALYMDEVTGERSASFDSTRCKVQQIVESLLAARNQPFA